MKCQDAGKGWSLLLTLLTEGGKRNQAKALNTQSRKSKEHSLTTLQRKLGIKQGPITHRAPLVSSSSQSR